MLEYKYKEEINMNNVYIDRDGDKLEVVDMKDDGLMFSIIYEYEGERYVILNELQAIRLANDILDYYN